MLLFLESQFLRYREVVMGLEKRTQKVLLHEVIAKTYSPLLLVIDR